MTKRKLYTLVSYIGFSLILSAFIIACFFNGLGAQANLLFTIYIIGFAGVILYFYTNRSDLIAPKTSFLSKFFLLYSLWLMVSPYFSTWFDMSRLTVWVLMLTPISFFIFTYVKIQKEKLTILLIAYLGFGLYLFAYGLLHFFVTKSRTDGPTLDANVYAAMILFFLIPVVVYWLIVKIDKPAQKRAHDYLSLYITFGFMTFFTTYSRSALIATVIVGVFLLIKIFKEYKLENFKRLIVVFSIVVVSFIITDQYSASKFTRGVEDISADNSVLARLDMWQTSLDVYKDFPVSGIGFGQFKHFYRIHRSAEETASTGDYAHNDYLQFLLEGGPIQLGFIIIICLYIIYVFFKMLFKKSNQTDRFENVMVFGLISTLCIFFIMANVNFMFYMGPIAIIIGGLLAYINKNAWQESTKVVLKKNNFVILCVIASFALLTLFVDLYIKETFYTYPDRAENTRANTLLKQSRQLSWIRPNSRILARYQYLYELDGVMTLKNEETTAADLAKFNEAFERVLYFNPLESTSLLYLGELFEKRPEISQRLKTLYKEQEIYQKTAEQIYLLSLLDNPSILFSYVNLRKIYLAQGEAEKAYFLFRDKLYKRFEYGEQSFNNQFLVISILLEDANKFGYTDHAKEYANLILTVDECNKLALESVGSEAPSDCL